MNFAAKKLAGDEALAFNLGDGAGDLAAEAAQHLAALQRGDGHIIYELEADATIPSEYIFLNRFMGRKEPELEAEMGDYLRGLQNARHDGWPLFHDGDLNISASVKAYYALKMIGDDPQAEHMVRARKAILKAGGAEKSNVFTRYALALFEQVPWKALPTMPVEWMIMPKWFPVTIWKVSYWSRTVIAPLLILAALKPKARNPDNIDCQELFCTPPEKVKTWLTNPDGSAWGEFFLALDKVLRPLDKAVFSRLGSRQKAIETAREFILERLNGEDGLGAIFPAMTNTVMAFDTLGVPYDDPAFVTAEKAVKGLLTDKREDGRPRYCQPCLSPVWDTSLAAHALLEGGIPENDPRIIAACDWLAELQITDVKGDWAVNAPDVQAGGWAFQYRNDYYPDVDDTAVVGMLLHRVDAKRYSKQIALAATWIEGMQSTNGGWGAFDIDNNASYLNAIPFADHGALLDPPTVDVAARCISFLAQIGYPRDHPAIKRGIDFIKAEQETDGSWFGRWGTNYIYGTWSALCALNAAGENMQELYIRRAVQWLKDKQRHDGGWGEDGSSYWHEKRYEEAKTSTPSQTAWAVLGLMAAGETEQDYVADGVRYLVDAPRENEKWHEPWFTAVGFPRVFYLRYHGYSAYFPIWALGRYSSLMRGNSRKVQWGI